MAAASFAASARLIGHGAAGGGGGRRVALPLWLLVQLESVACAFTPCRKNVRPCICAPTPLRKVLSVGSAVIHESRSPA